MSNQSIASVTDDDRAVAPVIGVVILFGFLILSLSVYQVSVVPQENAEVEFQHIGEVRSDLVQLRAGILQAGSIDQPQYQTVQLGTSYPTRVFAINPPSPAGTIRTVEAPPITISNESGTPEGTITIPTRFIQYRPGYNELDQTPTWYDASVLYVDARSEGDGIAVIEDQALVDGRDVQITAVQREFQRSGTGRVTLELRPAQNVTGEIPTGDLTVTIPTRLNESDWESKTDLTDSPVEVDVTDTGDDVDIDNSNIYNLTLNTNANNLTVDTVGVQEDPEDPTQNDNARIGREKPGANLQPSAQFKINDGKNKNFKDLDASPSSDPDGTLVLYEWDTDDDGLYERTGQSINDVKVGNTVTLRVTDDVGAEDTISKTIN
ncbi:hypothetical protein [Halorubrum yunnanense]|uniref:PKD domain-containing protein n=1 Tax=Halorubrum yunnanense TaxID=1526162 RepID=A0ABD5YKL5_9EURY|nr:hypothetical protein [Halorubrum yunnanense]